MSTRPIPFRPALITLAVVLAAGVTVAWGHDPNEPRELRVEEVREPTEVRLDHPSDLEKLAKETETREVTTTSDGSSNTSGSDSSGSNSGSSGSSGSDTSGSNSGSSDSSSSDTSGSNSGSSDSSGTSGSGTSGSNSGSSSDDSGDADSSGSNSGSSSNSGSGSDDDDDIDDNDIDDDGNAIATGNGQFSSETDASGHERRRGEFLVAGDEASIADTVRDAGYQIIAVRHLTQLDRHVLRVRVRAGSTIETDMAALQAVLATAQVEPNYVFRAAAAASIPMAAADVATVPATRTSAARLGIVDTGADLQHRSLQNRTGAVRAFGGKYTPRDHGTYVAQIAARQGVRVEVADVFQLDAKGAPLATAESIARGIDWMVSRGLPVINVSITGPKSKVLSDVVARAIARGSIIVAAAGNDGPGAPPTYPAAFPDVVGVTALDAQGRVYRRANRGEYVDFAAVGVRVPVTTVDGRTEYVSGTSFAAPLIAAAFARNLHDNTAAPGTQIVDGMRKRAVDLGERGRDPVFGWGALDMPGRPER